MCFTKKTHLLISPTICNHRCNQQLFEALASTWCFFMATSSRKYATCQQLQAQAQANAVATSGLLGHTELSLILGFQLQVESELTELPLEERVEFLTSLGVDESGLGNLIRATYNLLGLRTYFTSGEKETKAWTIHAGMTAPQVAGVIHSDFEKGFIRAETVSVLENKMNTFSK
ncbi:hypothetical protein L1987_54377 [Smallanthus sonchifolius]|uniref:Uncharacterized protein n=1 Tax=Smallanthus sonchifolius TaxID=185202 RepID=A0ACB9E6V4_9ASTR|nr:hypothetical protein L1987_54377 [Smallanthus sonchifolius]